MARPLLIEFEDAIYHLSGNGGQLHIFAIMKPFPPILDASEIMKLTPPLPAIRALTFDRSAQSSWVDVPIGCGRP